MLGYRTAAVFAVAAGLAASGCFQAYNPTSFPNWGYGGAIDRTHAKPSGGAYFKNFDPHACKLKLTPLRCDNPVGKQQLLVAAVVDEDGMPRRSRRVEWIVDGPGSIIEVDESGWYSARGYKVDNKYAVSHTDYKEHTLTRGNDDPRDDFTIRPGETWCVVSSFVEGETTVTAYAPEVFDWDRGRVTAKLRWGPGLPGDPMLPAPGGPVLPPPFPTNPGGVVFPPPVVSRAGGEVDLSTTVSRTKSGTEALRVRYKVIDGPPAQFASRQAPGQTTALYGDGQKMADVPTAADGTAVVTLRQPAANPGTSRVEVTVLRADGTVVQKSETTVEWADAELSLSVRTAKAGAVGKDVPFAAVLANTGKSAGQPVTVRAAIPPGATLVRTDPPAASQDATSVAWAAGAVPAGGSKPFLLVVKADQPATLNFTASAELADGTKAEQKASVVVAEAGIKLDVRAPAEVSPSDPVTVALTVTNTGGAAVEGVTVWIAADDGLASAADANPAELTVGTIAAGQTKKVEATFTPTKTGTFAIRANATADGGLTAKALSSVAVRRADVRVTVAGPKTAPLGQSATWEVRVANTGDLPVRGATLRTNLPRGMTAVSGSDGGRVVTADVVQWKLPEIPAGGKVAVKLTATGDSPVDDVPIIATVAADVLPKPVSTQAGVSVAGTPSLTVEIPNPPGLVPVGKRGTVKVTVRNAGTGPAKRVELVVTGSPELTFRAGQSPDGTAAAADAGRVAFPVLDEIPAGKSVVFLVDTEATTPGTARLQAEVRADHLTQPVRDEQSARVVP